LQNWTHNTLQEWTHSTPQECDTQQHITENKMERTHYKIVIALSSQEMNLSQMQTTKKIDIQQEMKKKKQKKMIDIMI